MDIGLAKSHCRESHDFMTCSVSHTLTSWVLISPLSQKVKLQKNLEALELAHFRSLIDTVDS